MRVHEHALSREAEPAEQRAAPGAGRPSAAGRGTGTAAAAAAAIAGFAAAAPGPATAQSVPSAASAFGLRHAYAHVQPRSDADAARFLLQAQFSASEAEIAAVRAQGYAGWLAKQFDAPATLTGWAWLEQQPYGTDKHALDMDAMIWRQLIVSADAVRKRLALALSEIFVVSGTDIGSGWPQHMMAQYWDMLVRNVGGNFRQLLEDVALNPAMGYFLNTRRNKKEDEAGRQPDENFAREFMQLMTIGLRVLLPNGNWRPDGIGRPIDSFTQDDVTNLARVFTGYELDMRPQEQGLFRPVGADFTRESPAWTQRPMVCIEADHSMLEARFLDATVPAGTPAAQALKIALDTLFNHPNVGPFIGRQLIQRLVTSNPSPAYVQRVGQAFADNGRGVRGDMRSVFAAVLLDDEARGPAGLTDPTFGRLREPMVRIVQWARTFRAHSVKGTWRVGDLTDLRWGVGQSPLRAPSVFNFFRPGYIPPRTAAASRRMTAPEFQLTHEASVAAYMNFMLGHVIFGLADEDVQVDYGPEKAMAADLPRLLNRLNLLLAAGQLSQASLATIAAGLESPELHAGSPSDRLLDRVYGAVFMILCSPEYLVQK